MNEAFFHSIVSAIVFGMTVLLLLSGAFWVALRCACFLVETWRRFVENHQPRHFVSLTPVSVPISTSELDLERAFAHMENMAGQAAATHVHAPGAGVYRMGASDASPASTSAKSQAN